jgi:hypothetical protein
MFLFFTNYCTLLTEPPHAVKQSAVVGEKYKRIVPVVFNLGARWSGRLTPLPVRFSLRKIDAVRIVQEAGWAPGPVWTWEENPAPKGIRTLDRPARSTDAIPTEPSRPSVGKSEKIRNNDKCLLYNWYNLGLLLYRDSFIHDPYLASIVSHFLSARWSCWT